MTTYRPWQKWLLLLCNKGAFWLFICHLRYAFQRQYISKEDNDGEIDTSLVAAKPTYHLSYHRHLDLVGRYQAEVGNAHVGPTSRHMARSRLYCLLTDTIQTVLARFLKSPHQHYAVGGRAHMPTKPEAYSRLNDLSASVVVVTAIISIAQHAEGKSDHNYNQQYTTNSKMSGIIAGIGAAVGWCFCTATASLCSSWCGNDKPSWVCASSIPHCLWYQLGYLGWRTVCMSMKMPVAVLMMFKMILRNKFTHTSNNSNI